MDDMWGDGFFKVYLRSVTRTAPCNVKLLPIINGHQFFSY